MLKRINRGRGHSYTLDGRKVDGVTTLLGKGLPKPALPYWSARAVAEFVADAELETLAALRALGRDGMVSALKGVPWSARDTAAVRGTDVHALAERLIDGTEVDVPDELAGHVESTVRFLDAWRPVPVLVEAVVASRAWRYAGTLDLVADLKDGRRVLLDYKTGKGIFPETALQLAAYRHAELYADADGAEHAMPDLGIVDAYAVHIRADGYDVVPVDTSPAVFKVFTHIAYVARMTDAMPAWVGESESPEGKIDEGPSRREEHPPDPAA